jgi:hypothetical protein
MRIMKGSNIIKTKNAFNNTSVNCIHSPIKRLKLVHCKQKQDSNVYNPYEINFAYKVKYNLKWKDRKRYSKKTETDSEQP